MAMECVVAAVDFSESSERAVELASSLAERFGARLWLVHVAAPDPDFAGYDAGPQTERDSRAAELRKEHRDLQARALALRDRGLDATALLVQGPTVETLVSEARRLAADMLVVGSHGRGAVGRALLGSVGAGVVRHPPCPVLVVPAGE
jgi:nucleotide-binding universal stress UspA family protein